MVQAGQLVGVRRQHGKHQVLAAQHELRQNVPSSQGSAVQIHFVSNNKLLYELKVSAVFDILFKLIFPISYKTCVTLFIRTNTKNYISVKL